MSITPNELGTPLMVRIAIPPYRAATSKASGISKSALVGIIVAAVLGLIALLLIAAFIVTRMRRQRRPRDEAHQNDSPILPIQAPDLEAGGLGGAFFS